MTEIKFDSTDKETIVRKIQMYFRDELDQEIGAFDAEFLLNFFSSEIGGLYYNQGLLDAQAALSNKLDELNYLIQDLEKPVFGV